MTDIHSKLMGLIQRAPYIGCEDVHRQYAVNWLMNNGVTVQKWIPVTERLPDVWQHPGDDDHVGEPIDFIVFIHGALIPTTLWFNGESFFDESGYIYNVTHWMPMPEPPKEAAE